MHYLINDSIDKHFHSAEKYTGGGQAHSGTHANLGGHETSTKLGDCGQKAHVTL